jgi:ssDNA-binding Zn-finger/Zn-ribbon topoisomerase 1
MVLRETKKFQWNNGQNRKFYGCSRYPACTEIHGAHPDGRPLGIPATKEVRELRMAVHKVFDRQWQEGTMTRTLAYAMMSERMGREFHVSNLDKKGCEEALKILGAMS